MNSKIKILIIAVAFIVLIAGSVLLYNRFSDQIGTSNNAGVTNTTEGSSANGNADGERIKAHDFTVKDIDGNDVKLSDMIGTPVVLNFWASWCPPCKEEMPDFEKVYGELGSDVQFMMINLTDGQRETIDMAKDYVSSQGFTFPIFFDTEGEASNAYKVSAIPTTVFIDKDGYIVETSIGMISEEVLREYVELVLNISSVVPSEEADDFPADFDKDKIAKAVVNTFNRGYLGVAGKILTAEDIDLSKAIKVYVGTNIFELKTNNLEEIVHVMEQNEDYFYFYPYTFEDITYAVTIQKNALLTKDVEKIMTAEEIKEYKLIEGTWDVAGEQLFDKESPYNDYYEVARAASSNKNDKPILVGGLPYFSNVVALYAKQDGNIDKIIPTVPEALDYESLEYDYEEVKKLVNAKTGFSPIWIILGVVFSIGLVIFVAMMIVRRRKRTGLD